MSNIRKNHTSNFKAKVALEALRGEKTMAELCSAYGVATSQIYAWKKQVEENMADLFADKRRSENKVVDEVDKLHRIIGQITAERDFLSRVLKR